MILCQPMITFNKSTVFLCRPFLGSQNMYSVFIQLLSSGSAWFAILLMVVSCLFVDVVKKVFDRQLHPTSTQKAQLAEAPSGVKCLDSICCFPGETPCASVGRVLDRVIGRCSPNHISRWDISLGSLCCTWVSWVKQGACCWFTSVTLWFVDVTL